MHDDPDALDDPIPLPCFVLKVLRQRRRGWTQQKLADESGVPKKMIVRYESEIVPPRDRMEQFLDLLGTTPRAAVVLLHALYRIDDPVLPRRSPVDPTPEEHRLLRELAGELADGHFVTAEEHLLQLVRLWRAEDDRREAVGLCQTLLDASPEKRRLIVEDVRQAQSWATVERLAGLSEKAAAHRADQALEIAGLAVEVAEQIPDDALLRSRAHGYALCFFANAQRVAGRPGLADETFARGLQLWNEGAPADPGLFATWRPLDRLASLRREQRRFAEARDLLAQARAAAPPEAAGRILLNEAFTELAMGDSEGAVATLRRAEPIVEAHGDTRLRFGTRFNLARGLCDLERFDEAAALVKPVRELALALRNELDALRTLWLQAKVWAGLGHRDEAEAAFEQVRRELQAHTIPFDYALATLELAALNLEQGRTAEVRRLAREMYWIFNAEGMHEHALAAIAVFQQAAEQEAATVELTRRVLRFLERAQHDPELRFEP